MSAQVLSVITTGHLPHHGIILLSSQIAKTLGSMSIRYRSGTKVPDRYLIDVDPRVFAIWDWCCAPSSLWVLYTTISTVHHYHHKGPYDIICTLHHYHCEILMPLLSVCTILIISIYYEQYYLSVSLWDKSLYYEWHCVQFSLWDHYTTISAEPHCQYEIIIPILVMYLIFVMRPSCHN